MAQPEDNHTLREKLAHISVKELFIFYILAQLVAIAPYFLLFGLGFPESIIEYAFIYIFPAIAILWWMYSRQNLDMEQLKPLITVSHSRQLYIFIPLIIFSIGSIWGITHLLSFIDIDLARGYFEWGENEDFLATGPETGITEYFVLFVLLVIAAPIFEELVFRGVMVERLGAKYSYTFAVLFSSALFGIMHSDIIGSFFFGIVLSLIYLKTRSLFLPFCIHALNNLSVFISLIIWNQFHPTFEVWENVATYIEYGWIGTTLLILGSVWLFWFIKNNWFFVHESSPVEIHDKKKVLEKEPVKELNV